MKGFIKQHQGGIEYLQSPLLLNEKGVLHGFSTRVGGVSRGTYATLNMGMTTGDDLSRVKENRRRFLSLWELDLAWAVSGQAVHGLQVTRVGIEERGRGSYPGSAVPCSDGLVTSQSGVVLTAFSADCQVIVIVDPDKRAAGIAHAGWRGILHGMASRLAQRMWEEFSSRPGDMKAVISPSICFECFETGEDVARRFRSRGWQDRSCLQKAPREKKYLINLKEISRRQLLETGLAESSVEISPGCTLEDPSLFYSHRRENGITGRQMGFVALDH